MTSDSTLFTLPEDGWFHIAAYGEWPHKPTGLTQLIDDTCADSIINAFTEFKAAPNWPGVLIDFDHQSLDEDKPTVAAGWIVDLQKRDNGLWARVRWSDLGRKSIEGGRYRFISPVWRAGDCAKIGADKVRPLKLMNCAVTNDPNIRGLFPLSNSAAAPQSISAPAMDLAPDIQQDPPHVPAPDGPPSPVTIPAPFSNAILANRTAWTPAETRARYRFALRNRILTDDQRRAMFARLGAGGPGDHGYGYTTPSPDPAGQPAAGPAPAVEPAAPRPNPYTEQAQALRAERDALQQTLRPAPERPVGFNPIDVGAAVREAMRQPGATASDVLKARADAEAENARRKDAWRKVENYYSTAYKDKAAGARALKKYVERLDGQYKKDLADWEAETSKTKTKIAELDTRIATAEAKAKVREWDDTQDAADAAAKARAAAIKEQIAKDKAEAQAALTAARTAALEAKKPIEEARREAQKPALFWRLLSQGNRDAAMQLYPDVNYAAAVQEYNAALKSTAGIYDKAKVQEIRTAFNNTPPPMGN